MDKEKLIRSLIRRAGIVEPPPLGACTFAGEPILVLHGGHESSLDIFDQDGRQIGTAKRTRGRHSRDGYRYRYELLGVEPGLILNDISKGRFFSVPEDFTILGAGGSRIASARRGAVRSQDRGSRDAPREPPRDGFVFERDGETVAILRKMPRKEFRHTRPRVSTPDPFVSLRMIYDRFLDSQLFYVEDLSGRRAARITYLPASGVGYVIELQPGAPELLSAIAVAGCLISDNALVSVAGNGGGG